MGVQLGAIALFTVPAVVLWWRAWTGGPASTVRCRCLDPGQQVWFVAWPAYALQHGLNIFSTTWLWPSHGVNLLANASSPLVGFVLAPVTWVFGPFVATTAALTLAPGLSAWGCWLACRRFVGWSPACVVGGLLFGYSPFVVQNVAQGHLGLGLLVVPPLILVVLHETLIRRQRSATWCGVTLAALLCAQFMISQEILTLTVLTAVLGVALGALVAPRRAVAAFAFAIRAFAVAAVVTTVVLAAPVWYMLDGPQHIKGSIWSGGQVFFVAFAYDLWNAGRYTMQLPAFPLGAGQGTTVEFLGVGVLVAAALSLAVAWRNRAAWVLAAVAVMATFCSWGSAVWLSAGHGDFVKWLPWQWVTNRPLLDNIESIHFAALADLAVAVIVAMGLGTASSWSWWKAVPGKIRLVPLVAVAAVLVLPQWSTYQAPLVVQKVTEPAWYATAARSVPTGSVIASYPFPASAASESQPMLWQVEDGLRFRLAGGYVKVPGRGPGVIGTGPVGSATWTLDTLTLARGPAVAQFALTAAEIQNLRSALHDWDVAYIVVADTGGAPVEAAGVFTAVTGRLPLVSHGAWVWDLRRGSSPSPAGAASAAATFASCRPSAPTLGVAPSTEALPQGLNRCITRHGRP
ncbi:MAG TPA: hypothetical protein VN796_06345 [Acidimicrobiales bacterium]|nr:hypothetical protein [Acidimicrobiales bacterium]